MTASRPPVEVVPSVEDIPSVEDVPSVEVGPSSAGVKVLRGGAHPSLVAVSRVGVKVFDAHGRTWSQMRASAERHLCEQAAELGASAVTDVEFSRSGWRRRRLVAKGTAVRPAG